MLDAIRNFFESNLRENESQAQELKGHQLNLASAALLIEVMNADHNLDERETREIFQVLGSEYGISSEELDELVKLARQEARQATSLYEFTRLINDNYDYERKVDLIRNMWRIAYSDGNLDKYEDHLIRKISELIYVSHSDFIRTKIDVKND